MEQLEHWIEIEEFPRYLVSNLGEVYDRLRDRILTQTPCRNGYYRVKVWSSFGRMTVSVARLVAGTFYDADISDYEVNHIDGDKSNNHIANLELCNRSEQMLHAFRMELAEPVFKPLRVRIIETGEIFDSTGQADRYLGVSSGSVSKTLRGIQPSCKGYTFEQIA